MTTCGCCTTEHELCCAARPATKLSRDAPVVACNMFHCLIEFNLSSRRPFLIPSSPKKILFFLFFFFFAWSSLRFYFILFFFYFFNIQRRSRRCQAVMAPDKFRIASLEAGIVSRFAATTAPASRLGSGLVLFFMMLGRRRSSSPSEFSLAVEK